jgi:hypothetical protein
MSEESEDARMRALFGDVVRPPMGDEDFVRSVMGRVQEVQASEKARRGAVAVGGIALMGAVLWPFKDAIGAAITLSAVKFAPDVAMLGGGASALIVAAVASLAAWAYVER